MRAICVDDEPLAVEYTLDQCKRLPQIREAKGFTDALAALEWLGTHSAELAILDINMPKMDGIELAARIKQRSPQTAILFLTAYREYAFDAWSVRPSGYLLKPVSLEKLAEEVRHACGAEEILRIDRGVLRVDPERFVCDAYLFFSGDSDMINAYRGEYMNTYSWASMTESILTWSTIK